MPLAKKVSLVVVCLLLLSCSTSPSEATGVEDEGADALPDVVELPADSSTLTPAESPQSTSDSFDVFGPGQLLPITAEADLAGTTIQLEVAETRQQQALGLMYRIELADDRGMLFPFEFPRRASFWMKNVPISLDMIFLLEGRVQAIAENVPPCEEEPCPTYGPGSLLVDQVIELRGGRAAEIGLQPGDTVEIRQLQP